LFRGFHGARTWLNNSAVAVDSRERSRNYSDEVVFDDPKLDQVQTQDLTQSFIGAQSYVLRRHLSLTALLYWLLVYCSD